MNLIDTIVDIISYSGIVQGLFFAMVLFTGSKRSRRAGIMLGILLSLFSFNIIHSLFLSNRFTSPLVFREPFITLLGPFLYFYVREIGLGLRLSFRMSGHFVLFVLFFIFQALLNVPSFSAFTGEHEQFFSALMLVLMLVQTGYYLFIVSKISHVHDRRIENEYSHIDERGLSWIRSFLLVLSVLFVILFASLFLIVHTDCQIEYNRVIALICAAAVNFLGFRGMRQRIETDTVSIDENMISSIKNSLLAADDVKPAESDDKFSSELVERIRLFMKERKPHLDPDITLTSLARELDVGRNSLSQAINSGFGKNFFSFINGYRVEEVISMFDDPAYGKTNLLRIAFDAGFNSKATFNHIFKKYTGFTPKEYKVRCGSTNPGV